MAGNFKCPDNQICSKEFGTAVGSNNTNLFFRTSTAITRGSGTQVTGGTTTLYTWIPDTSSGFSYGTGQGSWQPAARSTDGKKWNLLNDTNGKQVLGADAANSLLNPTGNLNKNVAAKTTETLQSKEGGLTPQQTQKVVKSNAATSAEKSGDQQSNPEKEEKPFDQGGLNEQISDKKGGVRTSYGNMKYPKNAKFKSQQDCIEFIMYRYEPKKFEVTSNLGAFTGENKNIKNPLGSVMLPIQPSISDSNAVSWGENPLDSLTATAASVALSGIQGGGEAITKSLKEIADGIKGNGKDITASLAAYFAGQAAGANQGFFTRATGAVLNNNLELLFEGPALRSFTFTFSMSARSKEEADEIRKIIRFFKQGMSVKRSTSALFLKTPNIFDIKYFYKDSEHTFINKIKTCALQNCVVNYTPAGNYATYDGGAMTQYDMTLTFGEIEPLFDDDYNSLGENHIGY